MSKAVYHQCETYQPKLNPGISDGLTKNERCIAKFTGLRYIAEATEPMNENIATAFGIPREIKIVSIITAIAITGPALVIDVKALYAVPCKHKE